jgi:HAD superfamily hydrolase (TIGR01509 family)
MFQAIIFDFDGTILDSELPEYQSWLEIFQAHGAELPLVLWQRQIGTVSYDFNPCQYLEEQIGRRVAQETIRQQRRQRFLALVAQEAIKPGVMRVIAQAQQVGIHLGVASSGTRDWVEGHLAAHKLRHHFRVVRTSADVQRVKPDPELYLSALAALEVDPTAALAIEDSRNGMLAAKRAGMRCLVVPNVMTSDMDFSEADWVIESLQRLPPDLL